MSPIPKVSFVVPCYRLAHVLPDCINSILTQTFSDFEILIMDDCSPDDTPLVAGSFKDDRVRTFRNPNNLGHLHNYNRGIELARGQYIWLISADDRLRVDYALERYVNMMETSPSAGYACCPAKVLSNGREEALEGLLGRHDAVIPGRFFVRKLLHGNFVVAASGMVRRTCYEKYGCFPLDLPYSGDWYLWLLFALHSDVAYLAEPLVNYRFHDLNMTGLLMKSETPPALREGFEVLWRILKHLDGLKVRDAVRQCEAALAHLYAKHLIGGIDHNRSYQMSEQEVLASIHAHAATEAEESRIQQLFCMCVGDAHLNLHNSQAAYIYYSRALQKGFQPTVYGRQILAASGDFGLGLTRTFRAIRKSVLH